ncbi:hypothetical protein D7S_03170 [Aggregatibacter actinomycetemcomitans D7S-1]|nr:hypothetical protein D7S_03170 [Aggregatibacter actinomycetemcomitans D7S-1]
MNNFNQLSRRDFIKSSLAGAAIIAADIVLPFNVMATGTIKKRTRKCGKGGMERLYCQLRKSLSVTYAC